MAPQPPPPMPSSSLTQLNPAAETFTMFTMGKKSEEDKAKKAAEKEARKAEKAERKEEKEKRARADKAEKAARKDKDKQGFYDEAESPQDSRASRDTPSIISTAEVSEASPRESLERSVSQATSDHAGSIGKESFMQKLSRKGSTSQFLTFGKKNPLFSKKSSEVPSTPDEADEESGGFFGGLGRSMESISAHNSPSIGTPKDKTSGLSWSSIKRIGKKDKTPSLHESITSEATGDEEAEGLGLKV
jgi:hypothetical protein